MENGDCGEASHGWRRFGATALKARFERFGPTLRGMLFTIMSGLIFTVLNTIMRVLALELDPFEAQFLRYAFGLVVMAPLILRTGLGNFRPNGIGGQLWRGIVHTVGLLLWFAALPRIPLADTTAIGFTAPIFIMIGAVLVLRERMVWVRWVAAFVGFIGVLIVVAPKLSGAGGSYNLVMLAASPMFAASFLITKALTRRDRPAVIVVWQALTVSIFSFPLALIHWTWPDPLQWGWFVVCGVLGSAGHFCLTHAFKVADISATQSVKFLDLIWAAIMGYMVFGDSPSQSTIVGGLVIFAATVWIAHREARVIRAPAGAVEP
jgi:drug/metabolite transporter (DMT)-like permease